MSSRDDSSILLSCRGLNFSYQDKQVLHNVSLECRKGEFIALLGKNGAGKSTFLSCLLGILEVSSGDIDIGGLDPKTASRSEIARKISFVPQEHDDMFPFSVLDVVVMGRTAYLGPFGAPSGSDYKLARQALAELYVSHLEERTYNTLSGGEKQCVLLARALVQTRKMVFLDEPTNHLDYKNRYQILTSLKKQCVENNSCVVACLHDPNHAKIFADRTLLLTDGKIIAEGDTADVMTGESLSRLYGIAVNCHNRSIEPCFSTPSFSGKVLLLVGASGEGKTTILQTILEQNKNKNLHRKFGGIISPGTWRNNRRYSSTVTNILTGEATLYAKRRESHGDSPFEFFLEGQDLADSALHAKQHHSTDCLMIDEVGPLELRDGGHAPHLAALLSLTKPKHIWAVRPSIVAHVCDKWMLVDPVIVDVNSNDAVERISTFLETGVEEGESL